VAGCIVFLKINLRKGYYQIPVNPAEMLGLPIDRAMEGVDAAIAFVDDIIGCSVDQAAHRVHLCQVLSALQKHSLVIHAEKRGWGAFSVDFVGHRVSEEGVLPLPSHVAAVQGFPRPGTMKELQAFLGIVNFYHRFLPGVAKTLRLLIDALHGRLKGSDVIAWTLECAAAFTAAKGVLLLATHLAHPTAGAHLNFEVDASATHVEVTLQQRLPGESGCRSLGFFFFKKIGDN
jgi:hypothetical protein